jgi:hypothetical protein
MQDPSADPTFGDILPFFPFSNWNAAFRRVNEFHDIVCDPSLRVGYDPREWSYLEMMVYPEIGSRSFFFRMLTPAGRGTNFANMFLSYTLSAVGSFEWALQRLECSENMHRLAWAVLLYQLETGEMPGENWAAQIGTYLGENADAGVPAKYFSCPINPAAKGETVYALVQHDDACADTVNGSHDLFLLVELTTPVPLDKAVVSADDVLKLIQRSENRWHHWRNAPHTQAFNVAYRSGAARWLNAIPQRTAEKDLHRALRRTEP